MHGVKCITRCGIRTYNPHDSNNKQVAPKVQLAQHKMEMVATLAAAAGSHAPWNSTASSGPTLPTACYLTCGRKARQARSARTPAPNNHEVWPKAGAM